MSHFGVQLALLALLLRQCVCLDDCISRFDQKKCDVENNSMKNGKRFVRKFSR